MKSAITTNTSRLPVAVIVLCSTLLLTACGSSSNSDTATQGDGSSTGDTNNNNTNNGDATTGDTQNDTGGTTTGNVGNDLGQALVLSPLPQPPLTPAPDASDEPQLNTGPVSSVKSFFLRRDPAGIIPNTEPSHTEAEFAAGLQTPVLTIPNGVDTTINRAPYDLRFWLPPLPLGSI